MLALSWGLSAFASFLAILVGMFLLEIVAGILLPSRTRTVGPDRMRPQVAVLVPAHNERAGIRVTIDDIMAQLRAGDRILVVADNCTDDTAAVAAAAGAQVVERHDLSRIGKGYALDYGLRFLRAQPPEIVIFVDADCRLLAGAVEELAALSHATGKPVQALYLMTSPLEGAINYRVAEFAWRVRNWVRPLGLSALGLPCRLTGAGMAFPWQAICSIDLASGEIVEDQKLGPDLTVAGYAPLFCSDAVVTSQFPTSAAGAETQRQRWEHGHLGLITTLVPQLIGQATIRGDLGLLALGLDLAVPPLALLALLLLGVLLVSGVGALWGASGMAFMISAVSAIGFAFGVLLCWVTHGRDILPPAALRLVVPYVVGKIGLYGQFLLRKRTSLWTRTERD